MKIPSFVWIAGIIVLGGGFLLILSGARVNSNNGNITAKDGLPIVVEIFSDYNCPHCASFTPFVNDVKTSFGDQVDIQKKHAPILSSNSNGFAYAAEAARLQDKFEEFNNALYAWISYSKDPANTTFIYTDEDKTFYTQSIEVNKLAERLGLDVAKFEIDRKGKQVIDIVTDQENDVGRRMGNISTPAVFIYGSEFNLKTYEDLKTKVQELISEAQKTNET